MIKIISREYSKAVACICAKLDAEMEEYDLLLSKSAQTFADYVRQSIGSKALIIVGNVGNSSAAFADSLQIPMFYDAFAEEKLKNFCSVTKCSLPPRHTMDKLCLAPESFNHYPPIYCCQCTCYGEYKKTQVYMIADNEKECNAVFDNYMHNNLFKNNLAATIYCYKVFGLSNTEVQSRLNKLGKYVSRKCETNNLDTRIILSFPPKCAVKLRNDIIDQFNGLFADSIYSASDRSLAQTVVELLASMNKKLSVAESLTGGLIASTIVEVPGASSVLYEGAVTYSAKAKCRRLGLNPHFIDEFGVVSQQVAQAMAVGLRKNGTDIALSTTGYAGPTSDGNLPVGLCYIGLATEKGVYVYKNIFSGDRNAIRQQAANTALFLLYKTIVNKNNI